MDYQRGKFLCEKNFCRQLLKCYCLGMKLIYINSKIMQYIDKIDVPHSLNFRVNYFSLCVRNHPGWYTCILLQLPSPLYPETFQALPFSSLPLKQESRSSSWCIGVCPRCMVLCLLSFFPDNPHQGIPTNMSLFVSSALLKNLKGSLVTTEAIPNSWPGLQRIP